LSHNLQADCNVVEICSNKYTIAYASLSKEPTSWSII